MNGPRAFVTMAVTTAAMGFVACDENPSFQKLGDLELTTSAPSVERELITTDGWTIKYDRFLVHVSAVDVAGDDRVLAASAGPQIIDHVAPGTKSLLLATVRTARAWEDVSLQIGPALADTEIALGDKVSEADRTMMQNGGLALHVEGKASKAGVTKSFRWSFTTDTLYAGCDEDRNGVVTRGLVVPPDGKDTADVVIGGEVLFSDELAGGVTRAEAIARADADGDGTISLEELRATSLDAARAAGGVYGTGTRDDLTDLGSFVETLTQRLVVRYRATGSCTPEPVGAEEE